MKNLCDVETSDKPEIVNHITLRVYLSVVVNVKCEPTLSCNCQDMQSRIGSATKFFPSLLFCRRQKSRRDGQEWRVWEGWGWIDGPEDILRRCLMHRSAFVLVAGRPNQWSSTPSYSLADISVAKMMIPAPGRSASQKCVDFILVDIYRHRQISTTFQFHISQMRYKSNVPWQRSTFIQREKACGLITTFLMINAMRRAAQ